MTRCNLCKGKGVLNKDGEPYKDIISLDYKAEIVGCSKNAETGKVRYNFWIDELDVYMHIEVPIEYYYMTTGARKWHHRIDKDGNKRNE